MKQSARKLISELGLLAHPEGGYFKEVYRSNEKLKKEILPKRYSGNRCFATSIYFLLAGEDKSHFHKIKSDEIWHFYYGSTIIIHELTRKGKYQKTLIGSNILKGEKPQYVIEKGNWFAAEVKNKNSFSLIGCTVAPGFDFEDFELAKPQQLIKKFPKQKLLIKKFCKL